MSQHFKKKFKAKVANSQLATQVQAKFQQALMLHQDGQAAQAQVLLAEIINVQPRHLDALHLLGVIAAQANNLQGAVALFDKAIEINPNIATFYFNRGSLLQDLNQVEAALTSYDQAIALKSDYIEAHNNRGLLLQGLNQVEAALASYDQAIAIKPDSANAYNNRGNALRELKQFEAALASYDQAIAIKPDSADVYDNRGYLFKKFSQFEAALASYDHALAIDPGYEFLFGTRLHTKMQICAWHDTERQLAELVEKIQGHEKASTPFAVLALSDSLSLQRKAAEMWVTARYPRSLAHGDISKHPRHEKIRLGYFSMDFRDHPVSFLTAELFEIHDRARFDGSVTTHTAKAG